MKYTYMYFEKDNLTVCHVIHVSDHKPSEPDISKTSPCNEYPLEPHFYIVKLGYPGVYLFFLFLLQNIDCGYSLDVNGYPQSMFCAKIRTISKFFN